MSSSFGNYVNGKKSQFIYVLPFYFSAANIQESPCPIRILFDFVTLDNYKADEGSLTSAMYEW